MEREYANEQGECVLLGRWGSGERERERERLCQLGYIISGKDQVLFHNNQSTFQDFMSLY